MGVGTWITRVWIMFFEYKLYFMVCFISTIGLFDSQRLCKFQDMHRMSITTFFSIVIIKYWFFFLPCDSINILKCMFCLNIEWFVKLTAWLYQQIVWNIPSWPTCQNVRSKGTDVPNVYIGYVFQRTIRFSGIWRCNADAEQISNHFLQNSYIIS